MTLTLTKFILGHFPHLGGKDAALEASLILRVSSLPFPPLGGGSLHALLQQLWLPDQTCRLSCFSAADGGFRMFPS